MSPLVEVPAAQLRWAPGLDPTSVPRNDRANWFGRALAVDSASPAKYVVRLAACHLSATEREAVRILTPDQDGNTEANASSVSPMMWSVMAKPGQSVVSQTGILYRVIRVGGLTDRRAMVLPCQDEVEWPSGPIDLCGPRW